MVDTQTSFGWNPNDNCNQHPDCGATAPALRLACSLSLSGLRDELPQLQIEII